MMEFSKQMLACFYDASTNHYLAANLDNVFVYLDIHIKWNDGGVIGFLKLLPQLKLKKSRERLRCSKKKNDHQSPESQHGRLLFAVGPNLEGFIAIINEVGYLRWKRVKASVISFAKKLCSMHRRSETSPLASPEKQLLDYWQALKRFWPNISCSHWRSLTFRPHCSNCPA